MAEYRRMKRRLLMVLFGLFLTFMPLLSTGDAHVLGFLAVLPGGPCTAAGILLLLSDWKKLRAHRDVLRQLGLALLAVAGGMACLAGVASFLLKGGGEMALDLLLLGVLSVVAGVWELREAAAGGQNPFSRPKKKEKRKKRR